METCRACQTAAHAVRRLGMRDSISWGSMGGPTEIIHCTFANAGNTVQREETEEEYNRRKADAITYGIHPDAIKPRGQVFQEYKLFPLCKFYQSELSWLMAGRPTRTTVYMAHPVSGPNFKMNVHNAQLWLRYLRHLPNTEIEAMTGAKFMQKPLILCPWLAAMDDDDSYPGGREGVIADARDTVLMFDEVWLTGGAITEGMRVEAQTARVLRDLTHLGRLPPSASNVVAKFARTNTKKPNGQRRR